MSTTDDRASDESAGHPTPRRVHIVPHTDCDGLVLVVPDLPPPARRPARRPAAPDGGRPPYARFLLDGQLAVVDDYLAVRPEAEAGLRRLVGSGRVAVGPWYTLPDESSSAVRPRRNLQLGRGGPTIGGAMPVSYRPTCSAMSPRCPRSSPASGSSTRSCVGACPWPSSAAGSAVGARRHGRARRGHAAGLRQRIGAARRRQGLRLGGRGVRRPVGRPADWAGPVDERHRPPAAPALARPGRGEANDVQDDLDLRVASLEEHLRTAPTEGLSTWRGELRSGARADLLMGVVSTGSTCGSPRPAERSLLAEAERRRRCSSRPAAGPARCSTRPGAGATLNSAHDSGACSIDDVGTAVLHRYSEAADIAEGLADRPSPSSRPRRPRRARSSLTRRRPPGRRRRALGSGAEAPAGTQLPRAQAAEARRPTGDRRHRAAGGRGGRLGARAHGVLARDARRHGARRRPGQGKGETVTGRRAVAIAAVQEMGEPAQRSASSRGSRSWRRWPRCPAWGGGPVAERRRRSRTGHRRRRSGRRRRGGRRWAGADQRRRHRRR